MEVITMDDGKTFCEEVWPYEESRKAFGFSTSVLQFVIPFIIISFCYIRVCGKLSLRARSMPGLKTARKEEQEKERTQKTNRMLIAMVIIFGVSWLPLNLHNLILDFYTEAARWKFARSFFLLAHAVAMSSCKLQLIMSSLILS
jgi:Na+/melibiose symporter-like transporter